jgi:hypothetical protein
MLSSNFTITKNLVQMLQHTADAGADATRCTALLLLLLLLLLPGTC